MYRLRFHGRGGQGMKTAARIVGSAFFRAGFEVQDAPRYGAERRGAPVFACVRAARRPILERGVIREPDLVVVADATLIPVPAAGVLAGCDAHTVLLIDSPEPVELWRQRLAFAGPVVALPASLAGRHPGGAALPSAGCAGAAARLTGAVSRSELAGAVRDELAGLGEPLASRNVEQALAAYDALTPLAGLVRAGSDVEGSGRVAPEWIDLPFDAPRIAAPHVHGAATSRAVRTGLWRTMRPAIDAALCKGCTWICGSLCPDSAISASGEGLPRIDYDHCKGCLVCVAVCPSHAITAQPEQAAASKTPS